MQLLTLAPVSPTDPCAPSGPSTPYMYISYIIITSSWGGVCGLVSSSPCILLDRREKEVREAPAAPNN